MKPFITRYGYILAAVALATVSFILFAPVFYQRYTSDNAVHALMAYYFEFPEDLYYWGQDRLGSFIPMMAAIPVKLLGTSPIWTISITQYVFLLATFFMFASFMRRTTLKLMLCVVWFFPLHFFDWHLQIGHPYCAQLFFTALALYLLVKAAQAQSRLKAHIMFFISAFGFMLSIWISDLSTFIFPLYLVVLVAVFMRTGNAAGELTIVFSRQRFTRYILPVLCGLGAGYAFIAFAKAHVPRVGDGYDILFSPVSHIKTGFGTTLNTLKRAMLFTVRDIPTSVHALMSLVLGLVLVAAAVRRKFIPARRAVSLFVLLAALVTFCIATASYWVEINDYAPRYFVFSYFLLMVGLALCTDRLVPGPLYKTAVGLMAVIVLTAAVNIIYKKDAGRYFPKNLSVADIETITARLGKCGIIGSYWNAYNLSSASPALIKATPWDCYAARDKRMVLRVLAEDKLYLSSTNWLDSFPPFRNEFGHFLVKAGEPFHVDPELDFCRYRSTDTLVVPPAYFGYRQARPTNKGTCLIKANNDSISDYIFFGPYFSLQDGHYTVTADIGIAGEIYPGDSISMDLMYGFGKGFLGIRHIKAENLAQPRTIHFAFNVRDGIRYFEIRTFLRGRSRIYMRNVVITRTDNKN